MAQHVNIPIAFEWHPYPASWKIATATITGLKPRSMNRYLRAKVQDGDKCFLVDFDAWSVVKTIRTLGQRRSDTVELVGCELELLVCRVKFRARDRQADPWTMRRDFLRLKRDTKALLAFMNKWGVWGPTETSLTFIPEGANPPVTRKLSPLHLGGDADGGMMDRFFDNALNYLLPIDLWMFQQECRTGLLKPAENWLGKNPLRQLISRKGYPHHVLRAIGCQKAIVDTIVIDHLRKVQFGLCARSDCSAPFAITTRHKREYCCQYCAHIESVRKQRKHKKEQLRRDY
jgi:hypothetical protein